MLLTADSPGQFVATHLRAHVERHLPPADPPAAGWLQRSDLLADDGEVLGKLHSRLVSAGTPAQAAATYLAGWVAGSLADVVGFVFATADAGVVVDPQRVAWHQHADGWMDRVDVEGCAMIVAAGHAWSGLDGVVAVADHAAVVERTVESLVATVAPIVEACHRLARVGRAGLWNEVADGLALAVCYHPDLPVREHVVEALHRLVRTPGAPWRSRPTVRIEDTSAGGAYIVQKGGCCLAYTASARDEDPAPSDDEASSWCARFPLEPAGTRYCSTCSIRDPADCAARQVFWVEQHAAANPA